MKIRIRRRTIGQIIFWAGFWASVPLLLSGGTGEMSRFLLRSAVTFVGVGTLVLVNLEVLMPRLYFAKKPWLYVASGLGVLVLIVFVLYGEASPIASWLTTSPSYSHKGGGGVRDGYKSLWYLSRATPYFTAAIGSALYEVAIFANQKEREYTLLRNEKLEAEMKFLKSQINPHFLFNTLNNIYTLTLMQSAAAPDKLLRLSEMLRYMLYDCSADTVPLHKEITYLRNYIDLKLLKDSQGMNVRVSLDESRPNLLVAPALFLPFVENAFKHSRIEDLKNGWIDIALTTSDSSILFTVHNSVPREAYTKDSVGGIGLENVQRQLQLIYPDHHQLLIAQTDEKFTVSLKITLA